MSNPSLKWSSKSIRITFVFHCFLAPVCTIIFASLHKALTTTSLPSSYPFFHPVWIMYLRHAIIIGIMKRFCRCYPQANRATDSGIKILDFHQGRLISAQKEQDLSLDLQVCDCYIFLSWLVRLFSRRYLDAVVLGLS